MYVQVHDRGLLFLWWVHVTGGAFEGLWRERGKYQVDIDVFSYVDSILGVIFLNIKSVQQFQGVRDRNVYYC